MSTDHQQTATAISTSTPQQQRPRPQSNSLGHKSDDTNTSNSAYRPCSPDLSAYLLPSFPRQQAQPPPPQQYNQQQQQSLFRPSYKDHSSTHSEYSGPSSWQQRQGSSGTALTGLPSGGAYQLATHRGSYDANPYFSPQASFCQGELQRRETFAYGSVSGGRGEYSRLTYSPTAVVGGERFGPVEEIPPPQQQHQPQQLQHLPTQGQQGSRRTLAQDKLQGQGQALILQPYPSSISEQQHQQQQPMRNMPVLRRKRAPSDGNGDGGDHEYTPEASAGRGAGEGGASAKPSRKKKSDSGQTWTVGRAPGETGPSLGIDIKTKFPVARIKRIMQADEDVGKVAQATPTAVSKALELFMITLVTKAAAEAKDRSSKRVTAAHLKQVVLKDQTFDFLQEIMGKVPDPTDKKGGRAASEDVDDEGGDGGGGGTGGTKRRRMPRGKKKADSDED